jgi:N-acetylglutamate synthase-like GNAT family acetyltransferase
MEGRVEPPSSALQLTPQSMAADAADGALLLAKSEDNLVGCVFVRPKGDALYIGKLAVRPFMHGRGIGKALVEAARSKARSAGLKALELQTRIELTENHAMFAKMGFMKTGETRHQGYHRSTSITMRAPADGREQTSTSPQSLPNASKMTQRRHRRYAQFQQFRSGSRPESR